MKPKLHFTPPSNWLNDPNGLVYQDSVYHLFYQHNPHGTSWGHMSWGHAVSRDLIHWEHLPVAMEEDTNAGVMIYSGSAVVDEPNVSGVGSTDAPPLLAFYTGRSIRDTGDMLQDIRMASSIDSGRSFTQCERNPLINVGNSKFGDPKVFRDDARERWVMVNIRDLKQGRVALYASNNLLDWSPLSEIRLDAFAPSVWECPDLFPLSPDGQEKWILKANISNPSTHAPSLYVVGNFDGTTFTPDENSLSHAYHRLGDLYAEVTYNNAPENRRILIGWLPMSPRDEHDWTGMMSLPREITLTTAEGDHFVCQYPVREIDALRGSPPLTFANASFGQPISLCNLNESPVDIELEVTLNPSSAFSLRFEGVDGLICATGYASGEIYVHRSGGTWNAAPVAIANGKLSLRIIVDYGVIEVFAQDGRASLASILSSTELPCHVNLTATGNAKILSISAWPLHVSSS